MANLNGSNVCVLIPVYNEADTIVSVIATLQALGLETIYVIDNGSTDDSAKRAIAAGAEVRYEPRRGYGQACWTGLQALPASVEWVFFCDGDGSDDLSALPQMLRLCHVSLAAHADGETSGVGCADTTLPADLVLGDRRATAAGQAALTPAQRMGNRLATRLMAWGWGYRYRDLGPLRVIRRSALDAMEMRDRGFGWTVEMQVRAIEQRLRIYEIPVAYLPRQGGRSKISGTIRGSVQAGIVILTTLGQLYWQKVASPLHNHEIAPGTQQQAHPTHPRTFQFSWLSILSGLLIVLGCAVMVPYGDFQETGVLLPFSLGYGVMGLGFVFSWRIQHIHGLWFWAIALISRGLLLAMAPGDDIWRYLWEGLIQTQGFSPYEYAPMDAILEPLRTDWWSQINRATISAIYPPLTQWGFRGLAAIAPSVLLFKLSFVITDLISCGVLARRFGYGRALTYSWNPLILYCFAGGGHYDSWFVLALVLAWLSFDPPSPSVPTSPRAYLISAAWTGISIALKWLSLPLLVFISWRTLRRFGWAIAGLTMLVGVLPLLITALPYCYDGSCPLIPSGSGYASGGRSADLIPELVGRIWAASKSENWLFAFPLALWTGWLILRSKTLLTFTEFYLIGLLALSPIIHSWYFTWLIPFAVATQNSGTRWLSLSAVIYFALPYRQGLGHRHWALRDWEKPILWIPGIGGWISHLMQTKSGSVRVEPVRRESNRSETS